MTVRPTVLTIILNYKTPDMTLQAVAAALREMQGIQGQLIVVDNDSRDGSFEKMQSEVSRNGWGQNERVKVVQSGRNGGFGAGNNFGILTGISSGIDAEYIYILNSDAFPDKGSIKTLVDALEGNAEIGFAGSYIHGPDGEPHATAFRFPSIFSEFEGAVRFGPISKLLKNHIISVPIPEKTQTVDWLAGASMMMRRSVLQEIGLFDEQFFLYFEETDLCRRAALAGHKTVYIRESEVTHIGSVSTGMKTWQRMPKYWFASRHHYFVKNHGLIYALGATLLHVLGGVLWRIRRVIQGKPKADPDHFLRDLIGYSVKHVFRKDGTKIPVLPVKPQNVGN